jgi:hypothetical protein
VSERASAKEGSHRLPAEIYFSIVGLLSVGMFELLEEAAPQQTWQAQIETHKIILGRKPIIGAAGSSQ